MPDAQEISSQRRQHVQKHRGVEGDALGEVQVVLYCWGWGRKGLG